jgi:hypothetical protein
MPFYMLTVIHQFSTFGAVLDCISSTPTSEPIDQCSQTYLPGIGTTWLVSRCPASRSSLCVHWSLSAAITRKSAPFHVRIYFALSFLALHACSSYSGLFVGFSLLLGHLPLGLRLHGSAIHRVENNRSAYWVWRTWTPPISL